MPQIAKVRDAQEEDEKRRSLNDDRSPNFSIGGAAGALFGSSASGSNNMGNSSTGELSKKGNRKDGRQEKAMVSLHAVNHYGACPVINSTSGCPEIANRTPSLPLFQDQIIRII